MKKKIIPIIAGTMAIAVSLSGCSCSSSSPLAFNNNFNGGQKPSTTYKETLTYNVEYIDSYGTSFSKSESIPDNLLDIEINGTYQMTLEVIDKNDTQIKNLESQSNIVVQSDDKIGTHIYKLSTNLELETVYSSGIDGNSNDQDDGNSLKAKEQIITTAYFLSSGYSFNPIYSKTQGINTSYVTITSDATVQIAYTDYVTEVKYNVDDYTVISKYGEPDKETGKTPIDIKDEYSYSYRTLIDNNMLLFALRNVDIEEETSIQLPTVHPTYGEAQNLAITYVGNREQSIKIDDMTEAENIKVKEYSMIRNVQNATGSQQFIVIQKEKSENVENKALLIQYVTPLNLYNSYLCIGGLKYSLVSTL